jgi:hypothetical protein
LLLLEQRVFAAGSGQPAALLFGFAWAVQHLVCTSVLHMCIVLLLCQLAVAVRTTVAAVSRSSAAALCVVWMGPHPVQQA